MIKLLQEPIEAFTYIKRQQGWRTALIQAGQFLKEPFYEHHDGYVLRKLLDEPVIVPEADVEVELRLIGPEDLDLLKTIMPPLRVKRVARKLQAGEVCNAAIREKRMIAYVLAGFENTPSTRQVQLKLDAGEAYLWSGYALPLYRRQKVVKVVNLSLCRMLQEKGFTKVVLLVEKDNQASLGHCFKMGYHITDRIEYTRMLTGATCRITPTEMDNVLNNPNG